MFRGKNTGLFFPCNTWAQVAIQADFEQIRAPTPSSGSSCDIAAGGQLARQSGDRNSSQGGLMN